MGLSTRIRAGVKEVYAPLDTRPSRRDLLQFGVIVLAGAAVVGAGCHLRLLSWMQPELATPIWIAGGATMALSLVPPIGRVLYVLWMGLGLTLGFFTVPIVMFAIYALAIVPLGLWFKLRRRDLMRRRLDPAAKSYWEDYPGSGDPASYIRQY